MCLQFGFVIFWQKDFGAKAAHKMLVKLIPDVTFIDIFGAKADQLLGRQFMMLLMADRLWQISTKLWQLAKNLKPKVPSKISTQLLVKNGLNTRKFLLAKMCLKCQ